MENKTLVETAKLTKLSVSGVQRQISSMEDELNTQLFVKQNRLLKPTPEGDLFYEHSLKIIDLYEKALSSTQKKDFDLHGEFVINASTSSVASWLMDDLKDFIEKHNQASYVIQADDRPIRQIKNECDVFLRAQDFDSAEFEQKKIKNFCFKLFASEEYIRKYGTPKDLKDLNHHKILVYGTPKILQHNELNWHLAYIDNIHHNTIFINSGMGILRAIESHLGIGIISTYAGKNSQTKLVDILPNENKHSIDMYMIYLRNTQKKAHIEKLYEHLTQESN